MARIPDEMLMAYADGALSKEDAEAIERALREGEGDAECRDAIDDFRISARLVRAAFADDVREPIPDALIRTVLGTGGSPTDSVVPFRRRRLNRSTMAMAASLAAVAVIGGLTVALGPWTTTESRLAVGPVQPGSQLASVLETVPASVPVDSGTTQLMIAGTFFDKRDRICREVEVMDSALTPQEVGVACRANDSGAWSIEGVARIAAASDPSRGARNYTPAGASEPDASKSLQMMLGAKEPLSADKERSLIGSGWRR